MHPHLTTVRQPMDAFGVSLATLVLGQIEGRPFQRTVFLPTESWPDRRAENGSQ